MSNLIDDIFGDTPVDEVVPIECPPPGVYYNVLASEYHAWPAISATLIKAFASLPSTCRIPWIPSDDGNVGTGIHCFSLQGAEALDAECFILPPECEGSSRAAKAAREEYAVQHPHKALLPHRYGPGATETKIPIMDVLQGVDDSLRSHPKVGQILANSQNEVSLVWIDADSGCTCKARIDILDGRILWDLKKCRKISGLKWEMDAGLRYRLQSAHYLNGAEACGINPVAFGFIGCESSPPYEVRPFYSDPDKTEIAQLEVKRLIGLIKQSVEMNFWPNFPPPPGIYDWDELTPDDTIEII